MKGINHIKFENEKKSNWHWSRSLEKGLKRFWLAYRAIGLYLEIAIKQKVAPGFSVHFGNKSSETPFDWYISFYWIAFFGSINFPGVGAFCEWIGRGHKRDVELCFYDGLMWWKLWYDDDVGTDVYHNCDKARRPKLYPWRWGRDKYRGWMCLRDGCLELNPLSAFWGKRFYKYEDIRSVQSAFVAFSYDESYMVTLRLQKQTLERNHGPKWVRRKIDKGYIVDWQCANGIPYKNSGGKVRKIYGSGVHIDFLTLWESQAKVCIKNMIKDKRAKYDYDPEKVS